VAARSLLPDVLFLAPFHYTVVKASSLAAAIASCRSRVAGW
jgi:hypothetical protein